GTTTGSGAGNITGGNAQTGQAVAMAETAAQMGLLKAQKENIEADTENKKQSNPNIQADTQSKLQGIENAKAQKVLTDLQSDPTKIEVRYSDATLEQRINQVTAELRHTE